MTKVIAITSRDSVSKRMLHTITDMQVLWSASTCVETSHHFIMMSETSPGRQFLVESIIFYTSRSLYKNTFNMLKP